MSKKKRAIELGPLPDPINRTPQYLSYFSARGTSEEERREYQRRLREEPDSRGLYDFSKTFLRLSGVVAFGWYPERGEVVVELTKEARYGFHGLWKGNTQFLTADNRAFRIVVTPAKG